MTEKVDDAKATETVLVPFGNEHLALSVHELNTALQRGRELTGTKVPAIGDTCRENSSRLLDAQGMEAKTQIPASWFLEQARQQKIPHVRAGKYVRFELDTLLVALRNEPRHADRLSAVPKKLSVRSSGS